MPASVYLNGELMPAEQASISPMDRGFLFGDGVYEVIPVYNGQPFCLVQHLRRLQNSCDGIQLTNPYSLAQWKKVVLDVIAANVDAGHDQSLYIQVTRGAPAARDHLFPESVQPTVFVQTKAFPKSDERLLSEGAKLISSDEIRWQMCHLKTTSLVANVLLKQQAHDNNADEVVLIRDGYVQECSVSNCFIVKDGVVTTPPKSNHLLPGITRDFVLHLLAKNNIQHREASIAPVELEGCDEIWISSSTKELMPATMLNEKPIGTGKPGELWRQVYTLFQANKYDE